ncbi:MAG TPA: amidohydrolase family protein [Acidimicrobiales bacterium]|nr:amidohydrolase family protein [Acidimicrobiales bacterium]
MTDQVSRVVDSHVHLWDPANTAWYPYLSHPPTDGDGDPSRMFRPFDVATYRTESARWNVEKFVNVAAATGRHSVDEAIELDRTASANGGPHAIIGGLPPTDTVAEAIQLLDQQMTAPLFRGVRPMGGNRDPVPPREILQALKDRGLVFELMARGNELRRAALELAHIDGTCIVIEHTGWPRSGSAEEFAMWKEGMQALTDLGPQVVCKLSGLAMPLKSMKRDALGPWLEHAIDIFGVDRCMFASNFPVDATFGSFDDLYETFSDVAAGLDALSRDKLFAATAERVYRL